MSGQMDHDAHDAHEQDASRGTPTLPVTSVVVVGIDGSETSWDAFWWACGETKRLGGRVVAVFVGPVTAAASVAASFSAGAIAYGAITQTMTEEVETLRDELCGCAGQHGVHLTFVHAHGDTTKELLRVADELHADLIVVGKSTKARHQLAGSLGRRLVRCRDAPIIVVVP